MKKFFKSLALASIAMAGMLVSSCQIDDIITAFVPGDAVATIEVTVTNGLTGEDITSKAQLSASSDGNQAIEVAGNVLTLKGKAISKQKVTVVAKCDGYEGQTEVQINPLLAGGVAKYAASITIIPAEAAVATITVKVLTEAGDDVTSQSEISATSDGSQAVEKAGNVLTIKGSKEFNGVAEQNVKVVAKYDDKTAENTVHVNYLRAGEAKYAVTIVVDGTLPPPPVVEVSYTCNMVSYDIVDELVGKFSPSHQAGHSHDGSIWAYNATEFILKAKFNWNAYYGTVEVGLMQGADIRDEEIPTLNSFFNALNVITYKEEQVEVEFPISAFAMYTVFGTQFLSEKVYNVTRWETIGGVEQDPVVIGKISVYAVDTQVEYMEKAVPGHEGHYHEGHGHADTHGYSNNAGGGIVWGD